VIEKRGNAALGGQEQFGLGEHDHLGDVKYVVCAGEYMSTRQAIFLKLTTAAAAILVIRLNLGATGGDTQSFLEASFR
jgi:hypothetical protein